MTISKEIIALIKFAGVKHPSGHGLIDAGDEIQSQEFRQEIALYDDYLSEEQEAILHTKIAEILEKITERSSLIERALKEKDRLQDLATLKEFGAGIPNKINQLRTTLREFASAETKERPDKKSSLKIEDPSWIMQMRFQGATTITKRPDAFEYRTPSKTTKQIVLVKKEWEHLAAPFEHGFIIPIVNCDIDVSTKDDSTVSDATLSNASPNDLEVFDSVHEIERLYGKEKFGLGGIKVDSDDLTIDDDYDISEIIANHFSAIYADKYGEEFSAGIYIISESSNLLGQMPYHILDRIPFQKLKEVGINDLHLEFISCNTLGIAETLMLTIEECAERLEMKITTHFHNGYIQNNSSYCYIDENEYVRVAQDPTITPKMLFDEESKPKKSRLMSVLTPGFSNIVAQNSNDLTEKYVRNKAVDKKGSNITMKLIAPGIELPKGISWKYTADYRQRELDISAARPLPMQHFPSDPTVVSQEQEAAASSTIKTAKAKSISEVLRSGKYGSMKTAGGAHEL